MRAPIVQGPPPVHRINVTPIIDVALVLVIVLLVTAPLLSVPELEVDLPSARTRDVDNGRIVLVTVNRGGEIAVDEKVASMDEFPALLRERLVDEDRVVVVRADAGLAHAQVERVLDEARRAGAVRLAIATTQKVAELR